jgi:hypothetical protein
MPKKNYLIFVTLHSALGLKVEQITIINSFSTADWCLPRSHISISAGRVLKPIKNTGNPKLSLLHPKFFIQKEIFLLNSLKKACSQQQNFVNTCRIGV